MEVKNKDIVFIVNAMGRGGASRVISILANHYAAKNWNVTLIMFQKELNLRVKL